MNGAARTPAATLPEELQRQSDRIREQLAQLKKMLGTISTNLAGMSGIMEKYSPELQTEIDKLLGSISMIYSYFFISIVVTTMITRLKKYI